METRQQKGNSISGSNPRLQVLKNEIRAIVMSAGKSGVLLENLQRDFKDLNGKEIPYEDFGFMSLQEFIFFHPDVVKMVHGRDGLVLFPVNDQSTCHLSKLINHQVDSKPVTRIGGIIPECLLSDPVTKRFPSADTGAFRGTRNPSHVLSKQGGVQNVRHPTTTKIITIDDAKRRIVELLKTNGTLKYNELFKLYADKYGERLLAQQLFGCTAKEMVTSHMCDIVNVRLMESGMMVLSLRKQETQTLAQHTWEPRGTTPQLPYASVAARIPASSPVHSSDSEKILQAPSCNEKTKSKLTSAGAISRNQSQDGSRRIPFASALLDKPTLITVRRQLIDLLADSDMKTLSLKSLPTLYRRVYGKNLDLEKAFKMSSWKSVITCLFEDTFDIIGDEVILKPAVVSVQMDRIVETPTSSVSCSSMNNIQDMELLLNNMEEGSTNFGRSRDDLILEHCLNSLKVILSAEAGGMEFSEVKEYFQRNGCEMLPSELLKLLMVTHRDIFQSKYDPDKQILMLHLNTKAQDGEGNIGFAEWEDEIEAELQETVNKDYELMPESAVAVDPVVFFRKEWNQGKFNHDSAQITLRMMKKRRDNTLAELTQGIVSEELADQFSWLEKNIELLKTFLDSLG